MLIYESKGISMKEFSPFLWGAMATDAYKLKQKKAENLFLKNSPNKVLGTNIHEFLVVRRPPLN